MSLIVKSVIGRLVIVALVCVAVGCTTNESKHGKQQLGTVSVDSCSACSVNSFFVKQASTSDKEKILIRKPVAICFFNRAWMVDKYDNENSYDTLMKLFKMRDAGDRNVLYALRDQYFYFREIINPILVKNSIDVVDSITVDRLLEFQGSNGSFLVNPKDYQNQDGVLFFKPGKDPLFWTLDREGVHCKMSYGIIAVQYFLCANASKSKDKL